METNMVNNLKLSTDQVLMKEIASGNQESMERLVDKWKNVAFRFFNRSLKNEADAEDLTQQLFIKIYRSASSYKPKAKFSTFLFTVARNLLIDQIKKNNRRFLLSFNEEMCEFSQSVEKFEKSEWQESLDYAMRGMPEYHRTAILLRVQSELSYREIAEIMKVSESRVKTWIYRARSFLKESIGGSV
jgi:RNA polymerase sigma-70 factor (ECF subfamily)